ncbi:MAG: GatB/YqeY domain-containing protein [Desulfofustis sp.]|nr:GatB/YqeY domain-containing protein [Desulfofustis sp.]
MGLQERIRSQLQESLKSRDSERTAAIRVLIGEFQRQPDKQLSDDQVVAIIKKLIKSETELLAAAGRAGSPFIEILEGYMPRQVDDDEIRSWIREQIDFARYANKMQAMKPIMAHFGSSADGTTVKRILQEF